MGIEKLLVNKQNILKNVHLNGFDKKTTSTNKLFFFLPSTYATSDAAAAEAGDDATTLKQYCIRFSIYLSTRKTRVYKK